MEGHEASNTLSGAVGSVEGKVMGVLEAEEEGGRRSTRTRTRGS